MSETLGKTQPDSYIEDIDKARYVADAEKPIRDHMVDLKHADARLEGMHTAEETYPGFHENIPGATGKLLDEIVEAQSDIEVHQDAKLQNPETEAGRKLRVDRLANRALAEAAGEAWHARGVIAEELNDKKYEAGAKGDAAALRYGVLPPEEIPDEKAA